VRNAKKMGLSEFISEIKHVENYPEFEKLVHVNSTWSTGVYG